MWKIFSIICPFSRTVKNFFPFILELGEKFFVRINLIRELGAGIADLAEFNILNH